MVTCKLFLRDFIPYVFSVYVILMLRISGWYDKPAFSF